MVTQVIQTGATVRIIADPRGIAAVSVDNGYLMILYTDGTTENAGYIGGAGVTATIFNTAGVSEISGIQVNGFVDAANDIDARLTALGY